MSFGKRHHHIQVVLKTIDHLWHHQVTRLVILQREGKECVRKVREGCKYEQK